MLNVLVAVLGFDPRLGTGNPGFAADKAILHLLNERGLVGGDAGSVAAQCLHDEGLIERMLVHVGRDNLNVGLAFH